MIPQTPNPCPDLQEGLSLGAPEHKGFVTTWNWILNIFRNIKKYLPTAVNGRQGNINIVAGTGIDVIASGNTITIGLGGGNSEDEDNPNNDDPNGGGAEDNPGIWQDAEPAETSGGSFGGGGSMFPWDSDTKTIGPGGCMVGRKWFSCTNGIGSDKADGLYQLRVSINNGGAYLAVVSDATLGQTPTSSQCWIPIYNIVNGQIDTDYRGAFVVPAYD